MSFSSLETVEERYKRVCFTAVIHRLEYLFREDFKDELNSLATELPPTRKTVEQKGLLERKERLKQHWEQQGVWQAEQQRERFLKEKKVTGSSQGKMEGFDSKETSSSSTMVVKPLTESVSSSSILPSDSYDKSTTISIVGSSPNSSLVTPVIPLPFIPTTHLTTPPTSVRSQQTFEPTVAASSANLLTTPLLQLESIHHNRSSYESLQSFLEDCIARTFCRCLIELPVAHLRLLCRLLQQNASGNKSILLIRLQVFAEDREPLGKRQRSNLIDDDDETQTKDISSQTDEQKNKRKRRAMDKSPRQGNEERVAKMKEIEDSSMIVMKDVNQTMTLSPPPSPTSMTSSTATMAMDQQMKRSSDHQPSNASVEENVFLRESLPSESQRELSKPSLVLLPGRTHWRTRAATTSEEPGEGYSNQYAMAATTVGIDTSNSTTVTSIASVMEQMRHLLCISPSTTRELLYQKMSKLSLERPVIEKALTSLKKAGEVICFGNCILLNLG